MFTRRVIRGEKHGLTEIELKCHPVTMLAGESQLLCLFLYLVAIERSCPHRVMERTVDVKHSA